MKGIKGRISRVLITVLATTFAMQLAAQDIVIDSGTDETVISRLPNAPEQWIPSCFDSADGTLGPCRRVPADF
ncbi:MAG: hypothetical protein R3330_08920, partial [Saprospiraceae bacterium]|nr:hypothetical protein [Saprospiraceae bacterium]